MDNVTRFLLRRTLTRSLAVLVGMTLAGTVGLWYAFSGSLSWQPILVNYLISVNVVTFGAYGYDKMQARRKGWRVPELSLLAMGLIGGTIGAVVAMRLFRHKTVKGPFRVVFWLLVAVQVVLVAVVLKQLLLPS
jgi:uncharacterized membrane protein YsdA (DUF1294 family)